MLEAVTISGSSPAGVLKTVKHGTVNKAAVLDELCVPFFFFDQGGVVTYANSRAHHNLKYHEGALVGKKISELDQSLSDELWQQIRDTIFEEKTLNYESHLVTLDRQILPGEFQFQYYENSGTPFVAALVTDISQRKEVEANIIAARESAMAYASQLSEKTRVAEEALKHVSELKLKQDGDYYLTSLLLQPFQQNRAQKGGLEIDWFVKQKTEFTYRRWHSEIGGDFCRSDTIVLGGRTYSLFVIADAMGKANQGASGALILATIVSTYVERTKKTGNLGNATPERWLRLLYEELRAGFAGFEGMMMIAVTIGLADVVSKYIYFFNAEQPRPVSYLRGKAGFIPGDGMLSKIGMPAATEDVIIELYQMQPGESVIFGSDGRDDIRLADSDEINYDDSRFLGHVEQASGELQRIFEITGSEGTIIDDFSLLKVHYAEADRPHESATAHELIGYYRAHHEQAALDAVLARDPLQARALALSANCALRSGLVPEGIAYLTRYLDVRPADLRALHSLVWLHCVQKNFESAVDIAERITYRALAGHDVKYCAKIFALLATIYRRTGNAREAVIRQKLGALPSLAGCS